MATAGKPLLSLPRLDGFSFQAFALRYSRLSVNLPHLHPLATHLYQGGTNR